jgi:addiction module HigA family antidote
MKPIHPGEHLALELKEMGMSAAEFSRQISVPTNRVTQILNGRWSITGDTALRLAHFFGTALSSGSTCNPYMRSGWPSGSRGLRLGRCPRSRIFKWQILDRLPVEWRYSARITAVGSAPTARSAGNTVPNSVVMRHSAAAAEKVSASAGSTPASRLSRSLAAM